MTLATALAIDAAVVNAGVWIRVSTGKQDEKAQEPDCKKLCADRGYSIKRVYRLNDKSASEGEQQEMLNKVIADMMAGVIQVLVCWHSDRLDRRGPKAAYAFLYAAELAGGLVESCLDPDFAKEDVGSEVLTTIRMANARDESKLRKERIRIAFDDIDANGAFRGRAIYGYHIAGEKKRKRLEIFEPEAVIIRELFARYLKGQSLSHIAYVFNTMRKLPRPVTIKGQTKQCEWSAKTLSQIMRSETIMGIHRQGKAVYRCPAIVSVRDWKAANAKLDAGAYRLGERDRKDTALLTSILVCGICGRNMYRRPSNRKKGEEPMPVYYCVPRKGELSCKMLIPLAEAEATIGKALCSQAGITITREYVIPGHNYQNDIDLIEVEINNMSRADFASVAEYRDALNAKLAEIEKLESLPAEPDETVSEEIDVSELFHAWRAMTTEERRSTMLDAGIRFVATKTSDGHHLRMTSASQLAA